MRVRNRLRLFGFLAVISMAWTAQAQAQDQKQEPEQLPLPKQVVPAPPPAYYIPYPHYPMMRPPRLDSREAWGLFAPNSMGQMRPRVVLAPYGSYYLYNGQPFFGASSGNGYLLPKTSD
jgi:hypothetical protein